MIEDEATRALLEALSLPRSAEEWTGLLSTTELGRSFRALGVSGEEAVRILRAVREPLVRGSLGADQLPWVDYFEQLYGRREEVDRLRRRMDEELERLVGAAWERAGRLLPAGVALGSARLVLLPLGLDFRTDREVVYIDPLAAADLGMAGIGTTLSHEFHHIGRFRRTGKNLNLMGSDPSPPPTDAVGLLRSWAEWVELEGIADCVANVTETDVPILHEIVRRRRREMDEYARHLSEALAKIRALANAPEVPESSVESLYGQLLGMAHPIGAGMAAAVRRELGAQRLVECVGDPELLFRRYDRVARARGEEGIGGELLSWLSTGRGPRSSA